MAFFDLFSIISASCSFYPLHAQPGGLVQVLFTAIQESPQALPVEQTLQHADEGGDVGSSVGHGVGHGVAVGHGVGGKDTVGCAGAVGG